MNKTERITLLMGGLAGLFYALSRVTLTLPGAALSREDVFDRATRIVDRYYEGDVTPWMLTAVAEIESGFNPYAVRYEPGLGDASIGMCQTLYSTARWLSTIGYTDYGADLAAKTLFDPDASLYFGGAYLSYLRRHEGRRRDDAFVVKSYNGGPGAQNGAVETYLAKYRVALTAVEQMKGQGDPGVRVA